MADIFGTGAILRELNTGAIVQELRKQTALQAQILGVEAAIRDLLKQLVQQSVPRPAVRLKLYVNHKEVTMGFQLQDIQSVVVTAVPVDADGNPTSLPAGVVGAWTTSDPTKLAVAPNPADLTGLTATASGTGGLGDVQLSVSAGPSLAISTIVTMVAGPATGLKIQFGVPTP